MNDRIIDILADIKDQFGDMVFYNHQKTKNLMHDLAPGLQKERIHVGQFLELNGYFQLKYAGHSYPIVRARLVQSYANTYAVPESVAIWVVDIFSNLLGFGDFDDVNKMLYKEDKTTEYEPQIPAPDDLIPLMDVPKIVPVKQREPKKYTPPIVKPVYITPIIPSKIKAKTEGLKGTSPLTEGVEGSTLQGIELKTKIAADMHSVAVMPDGTVRAVGPYKDGQCEVNKWRNIIAVSAGPFFTVGLREDGTVVACGKNDYGQCNVGKWRDIVKISCGARHTVGLRADGTVVAAGQNRYGECDVTSWRNIEHISAGYLATFGIKKDHGVLVKGYVKPGSLKHLEDISDIANPYPYRTLVLKRNGRLDVVGDKKTADVEKLLLSISKWRGLVQISAGPDYFVGLFKDGTVRVLAFYWIPNGIECNTMGWTDIEAIAAGRFHLLGVKKDGSMVSTMMHPSWTMNKGQCRVGNWMLI